MQFASTLALYLWIFAAVTAAWIEWTDPNRSLTSSARSWLHSWRQRALVAFSGWR